MEKRKNDNNVYISANKALANKHAIKTLGRARVFKNKKKDKPPKKIKRIDDFIYWSYLL